jgi:hypothetical protein
VDFLSLGLIQEWIPRGSISGVRDAVRESIDARVHSTMRALPHRVKVAGGNDTSLRKIKVAPPGDERCGEQRSRATR